MMRRTFSRLKREDGFTLSEMLVVISILGLILGAFCSIFSSAIHHSGEIQEQNLLQTEVQAATDRIAREVRQSYYGDTTQTVIKMSTGTQLQFYSLDNQQPYHLRLIAYRLNAGTLKPATATSPLTGRTALGASPRSARGPRSSTRSRTRRSSPISTARARRPTRPRPLHVRSVTTTLSVATGDNARPSVHVHDQCRSGGRRDVDLRRIGRREDGVAMLTVVILVAFSAWSRRADRPGHERVHAQQQRANQQRGLPGGRGRPGRLPVQARRRQDVLPPPRASSRVDAPADGGSGRRPAAERHHL